VRPLAVASTANHLEMIDRTSHARPPLTLIANSQEWHSRSLESILGPHGYAVLRAYTGKQAIERSISAKPDLIILDTDLPDRDGFDVCRDLRADPNISASTPILMTSPGHPSRQKRLEALRAGAWDFIGSALDGEELPLRLGAYVRAKQEVDRAREDSLLDELTGLYNIRGLARRARELGSQAFRSKEPLACIVLTPVLGNGSESVAQDDMIAKVTERLASVLRETGRTSDAMGMLGHGEFGVVAQGTDPRGAVRLAERLAEAANQVFEDTGMRVAVGYDAVPNYFDAPIEPSDMLMRASMAMRLSRGEAGGDSSALRIRKFEGQLH
jgi:PleD family two-component response regulator